MPDQLQTKRKDISVRFLPSGRIQRVRDSLHILALAQEAGLSVTNTCNGAGTCGKCLVRVEGPVTPPSAVERRSLSAAQLAEGWRLACQTWPRGDVSVEIPSAGPQQILTGGLHVKTQVASAFQKRLFTTPEPTLQDQLGDYERVCRALGVKPDPAPPLALLRQIPGALRPGWGATAVLDGGRLAAVEPGDTAARLYGAAFDIGTTTLVGYLHNLTTGEELAVTSGLNPQVAYGADVISRVEHVINNEDGLRTLQGEICSRLNRMTGELAAEAGVARQDIYEVSVAGNSVMQHLFLGVDPRNIAFAPYVPAVQGGLWLPAAAVRLEINSSGRVHVMPAIASYVGGDIVADILATRLWKRPGSVLLVDIGTNGEIVLSRDGRMSACAAPAGPAFEGASISCGMRAAAGAISRVSLTAADDIAVQTIAGARPRGFCGSGLVDAVAALLDARLLDDTGRLVPPDELEEDIPPKLAARMRLGQKAPEVVFAGNPERGVKLTQGDIRELQNAKGSIAAGIDVLCRQGGVEPSGLDEVLVAGAFGNFVRPEAARRLGLLPQVPLEHIRPVGNAAGAGARLALLSETERRMAEEIRGMVEYVELSGSAGFRDAYMEAMFFPGA